MWCHKSSLPDDFLGILRSRFQGSSHRAWGRHAAVFRIWQLESCMRRTIAQMYRDILAAHHDHYYVLRSSEEEVRQKKKTEKLLEREEDCRNVVWLFSKCPPVFAA